MQYVAHPSQCLACPCCVPSSPVVYPILKGAVRNLYPIESNPTHYAQGDKTQTVTFFCDSDNSRCTYYWCSGGRLRFIIRHSVITLACYNKKRNYLLAYIYPEIATILMLLRLNKISILFQLPCRQYARTDSK